MRIRQNTIETPPRLKDAQHDTNEILFSFQYLHEYISYKKQKKADKAFLCDFMERLKILGTLGWKEIRTSARHNFGMEKIPLAQIKPQIQQIPSREIEYLSAFRVSNDNRVFLGVQIENVFYILFIEGWFGDVYKHN